MRMQATCKSDCHCTQSSCSRFLIVRWGEMVQGRRSSPRRTGKSGPSLLKNSRWSFLRLGKSSSSTTIPREIGVHKTRQALHVHPRREESCLSTSATGDVGPVLSSGPTRTFHRRSRPSQLELGSESSPVLHG